jgi:hypothetical protein
MEPSPATPLTAEQLAAKLQQDDEHSSSVISTIDHNHHHDQHQKQQQQQTDSSLVGGPSSSSGGNIISPVTQRQHNDGTGNNSEMDTMTLVRVTFRLFSFTSLSL